MPCRHQELRSGRYQLSPNILKKKFFLLHLSGAIFFHEISIFEHSAQKAAQCIVENARSRRLLYDRESQGHTYFLLLSTTF